MPQEDLRLSPWEVAEEVVDSLRIGDHLRNDNSLLAGLQGFAALLVGSLRRRRQRDVAGSRMIFVCANPVAHGARFSGEIAAALRTEHSLEMVADASVAAASLRVDIDFPSLGRRSLARHSEFRALRFAVRSRAALPRQALGSMDGSRVWREFAFLAQSMRYYLASRMISASSPGLVVLTDFDRHAYSRPLIWASRRGNRRTATFVHGSPNRQNYLPFLADRVLVWGQIQAEWVVNHSLEKITDIVGRTDLRRGKSALESPGQVVFCHSAEVLDQQERRQLSRLASVCRDHGIETQLRLHPSTSLETLGETWHELAASVDSVTVGRSPLVDALGPGSVVVAVASSSVIDALVWGVCAVTVASEGRELPCDIASVREAQTADFPEFALFAGDRRAPWVSAVSRSLVPFVGDEAQTTLLEAMRRILS